MKTFFIFNGIKLQVEHIEIESQTNWVKKEIKEKGMTKKQKLIYDSICDFINKNGYSPSYEDIMSVTGLKSRSSVFKYVKALVERGYISHIPNKSRTVKPTKEIKIYKYINSKV